MGSLLRTSKEGSPRGSISSGLKSLRSSFGYRGLGALSTSFFLEKQAVVIDFGKAYTKVGFATESRPRHIVPSPELRGRRRTGSLSKTYSEAEWIDMLDRLLSKIYFHYLSVSPKERRVVICDPYYSCVQFRSALAFVLFKRMFVPSAAFVVDLVLPLYLSGLSSGLVIDCGYDSARVLATFAGVPVLSAFSDAACGGRHILAELAQSLKASLSLDSQEASWLEEERLLEDLMVRGCYVACDVLRGEEHDEHHLKTSAPISFAAPGQPVLQIPETCRRQPAERMFRGPQTESEGDVQYSCLTIPEACVRTLERCPLDVRAAVVQNIVVCGGCASLRGMLLRLALELQSALRKHPKLAPLAEKLLFTPLDFSPVCDVDWRSGIWLAGGRLRLQLRGLQPRSPLA